MFQIYYMTAEQRENIMQTAADQYCCAHPDYYLAYGERNGETLRDALVRGMRSGCDCFGERYICALDHVIAHSEQAALDALLATAYSVCGNIAGKLLKAL